MRNPVYVAGGCLLIGLMIGGVGCVRRTVTIQTAPAGARVVLNDREVGTTPVTVPFTWYGDYDVVVRKDGYETLHTNHPIERPWYQYPPIDLVAEAMMPFTIHDEHQMYFELQAAEPVDHAELVDQARQMRERALFSEE